VLRGFDHSGARDIPEWEGERQSVLVHAGPAMEVPAGGDNGRPGGAMAHGAGEESEESEVAFCLD
jgi:hypothetical protein